MPSQKNKVGIAREEDTRYCLLVSKMCAHTYNSVCVCMGSEDNFNGQLSSTKCVPVIELRSLGTFIHRAILLPNKIIPFFFFLFPFLHFKEKGSQCVALAGLELTHYVD